MEHDGPKGGQGAAGEKESGYKPHVRSPFTRHLRIDKERYQLHPDIIAQQNKTRDGPKKEPVVAKPIISVEDADLQHERQPKPDAETGIAPDEGDSEAGISLPGRIPDVQGRDIAARSDPMLDDYETMEKAIRTLDENAASEGLRVLEKMKADALALVRAFPEHQQLAELHRLMNALDYLVGRACGSTQPKEWFKFIENNPKIFEFALVAKRFDINEMGNARVLDLSKRLDQKLLDRIEGKTDGLATTQEKFVAVADLLAESNRLTDEDAGLLKTQLSSGDDEKKGMARARINEILLMRSLMIENGLSDARNPDTFDIVKVDAVMFTRESRVLLVESMPGRAPIYDGLGGLYNRCSNAIIVVKKETKLSEKEQNEMKKTMMSLGVPDSGGKNGNGELPPDAVMWHEVRHYLDALSGYLQRCKELAQDGKTIRAVVWTPERLPAGVLTEATAFADGYIRSGMGDEQIRADMEGSRGGMGIHSWARSMGIGWWMRHVGEDINTARRLPELMRRFIDEEYVRVLGISSSELYGAVGKTPAEILRGKGGRTGGARAKEESTDDIARTHIVGPEIFEAALKKKDVPVGHKLSEDEQARLDKELFSLIAKKPELEDGHRARRLVESGANPNARDADLNTPLIMASVNGNTDALLALLEKGAEVDGKDRFGSTPFMYSYNVTIARSLLERGADPAERNIAGWNAITYALENAHSNIDANCLAGLIAETRGNAAAMQILTDGIRGQIRTRISGVNPAEGKVIYEGREISAERAAQEIVGWYFRWNPPREYWDAVRSGIVQEMESAGFQDFVVPAIDGVILMQALEPEVVKRFIDAYSKRHAGLKSHGNDLAGASYGAADSVIAVFGGIKTAADALGCDVFIPRSQEYPERLVLRLIRRSDTKAAKIFLGTHWITNRRAAGTRYDWDSDFAAILRDIIKESDFS